jgi:elongation factor 1 alpha-like protein
MSSNNGFLLLFRHVCSVGSVLCDPEHPIPLTKKFKAQILTFSLDIPLMRGHRVMLHYQNMNEPARLVQLLGILDKNAEIKTKKPRFVLSRSRARQTDSSSPAL